MDINLEHEDLLIKLRSKLNEEKIKLWESPYFDPGTTETKVLQDLATKYSSQLNTTFEVTLEALKELQQHSIERSKANVEFKETGLATLRVKAAVAGAKAQVINVQKKLDAKGSELLDAVCSLLDIEVCRLKLIYNGKVINPDQTLSEQGVKNGVQIMALVMAEPPEAVKKEDEARRKRYMEMKKTRDDATLLSESVDDYEDDEYMRLEDQSGCALELPPSVRRPLLVGLALHERGRAAAAGGDYALALVLLLEADDQFSSCRSSIERVDNWAVLQLDICWCYVRLRALHLAADAQQRLALAQQALNKTYGERQERLLALKGSNANERVLFMRLYLLQGIVAYHQNRRSEAQRLLQMAEAEINALRVNEESVCVLVSKGWTVSEARWGLREAAGEVGVAHGLLGGRRGGREAARGRHRDERVARALGQCVDGSPLSPQLVTALQGMGFRRSLAAAALRNSNNSVSDAVRLIQEQPEMLRDNDMSSDDSDVVSSDESLLEPDEKLLIELSAMGYDTQLARNALVAARNKMETAVDLLLSGALESNSAENPSTSAGSDTSRKTTERKERRKRKKERDEALKRLRSEIKMEEDAYLDTTLTQEEELLNQYKSFI